MKTLLTLSLMLASLSAYAGGETVTITCGNGGASVRVSGNKDLGLSGGLTDNYNSANLACQDFAYQRLEKAGGTLPCVGYWNIAFDASGNGVFTAVEAQITRQADGRVTATYVRNWDGRDHSSQRKITVDCEIQEN
jgi:hypothetical protein